LSHANAKGMGTNDWVIRSLDYLKKKRRSEEVRSLEEISKNLFGNLKIEIPFKMTNTKPPS
jgi:hypothetical protein